MKPRRRKVTREDPVVAKLRAIRRRMLKEAGGTTEGYLELHRHLSQERAARGGARRSRGTKSA